MDDLPVFVFSFEDAEEESEWLPEGSGEDSSDEEDQHESEEEPDDAYSVLAKRKRRPSKWSLRTRPPKRIKKRNAYTVEVRDIPFRVNNWSELFKLAMIVQRDIQHVQYRDCRVLARTFEVLKEIDQVVGLADAKNMIASKLMYWGQRLDEPIGLNHICVLGPSGTGKTMLAEILARLFHAMGKTKNRKIVYGTRSNLIGKYVGHTAQQTQQLINKARGGVLFIDEVYSLVNGKETEDSFGAECVATLVQNLQERSDFVCIISGYEIETREFLFASNPGLSRRFPWEIVIRGYTAQELFDIFKTVLAKESLTVADEAVDVSFFGQKKNFPQWGGSVHNLVQKIKVVVAQRSFGQSVEPGVVIKEDIEKGFELYKTFELKRCPNDEPPAGMYT